MIYVDSLREYPNKPFRHAKWCHMWTDGDVEDLHEMATKIGLRYAWFQTKERTGLDHYDLVPDKRKMALTYGAKEMCLKAWFKEAGGTLRDHTLDDSLLGLHLKRKAAQP